MILELVVKKNPKNEGYIVFNKKGSEKIVLEVTRQEMEIIYHKILIITYKSLNK